MIHKKDIIPLTKKIMIIVWTQIVTNFLLKNYKKKNFFYKSLKKKKKRLSIGIQLGAYKSFIQI